MTRHKPKMICPFCKERTDNGNYRAFAVSGIPMHIRMKHPEKYAEFTTHRAQFVDRFSCDEEGNPTSGQPIEIDIPSVAPEAISEPEPTPEPEPKAPLKEKFRDETNVRKQYRYGFSDD